MIENNITFIIPSLNRPTLKRTMESLIQQSNPSWRAIVVYDGVDGESFDDGRVKTIKIDKTGLVGPNNGQSGLVRNEGIKLVDTEWIGFLDDDDTINKDYVKTLFEKYSNNDFVVWRMTYENGLVLPPFHLNELKFATVGISFCYKKTIFKELFFSQNRDGEDFDFLMELKKQSNKFVITPEVMYNVRH
jgi:glycosyltransferase involved in cell wall biosynthesis